jgi:hypothetical protein
MVSVVRVVKVSGASYSTSVIISLLLELLLEDTLLRLLELSELLELLEMVRLLELLELEGTIDTSSQCASKLINTEFG